MIGKQQICMFSEDDADHIQEQKQEKQKKTAFLSNPDEVT